MLVRVETSKIKFEINKFSRGVIRFSKNTHDKMGGPKYARDIFFRILKNGSHILLLLFHADSESEIRFEIGDGLHLGCCSSGLLSTNTW